MIVSASYKTDIPAFYGEWFINRLDAGYCLMVNPYGRQVYRIRLEREHVDGFVFWTKNLGPFFDRLAIVQERGYPFLVQYTINGYPRTLEFSVVNPERSIEHMKSVSEAYGPEVAVWRYDTIIFSSVTPPDFHRSNFERLSRALEGTTNEVVVSFAQIYQKTLRNMNWAAKKFGFTWEDPADEVKLSLLNDLAEIAKSHKMQLTMCSQPQYSVSGVINARCVDVDRLSKVADCPIGAGLKGNRPGCGCYASKDIGEYDTCPHGCVYCYAVLNRELAQSRFREHDPEGEFLFEPKGYMGDAEDVRDSDKQVGVQIRLI